MESNGIKGHIQVSQSTADEIVVAGKEAWIVARQDKIKAKGKGELQTYLMNERFMKVKLDKSMASTPRSSDMGDDLWD
jgi:ribosomal 30S subunit maturation factor RimM